MRLSHLVRLATLGCACFLSACSPGTPDVSEVLDSYRAVAHAAYAESHARAVTLAQRVEDLVAAPGPDTLAAARQAWRAARVPYSQSEGLRFGNWFVDEWETRVNAWPVDEGFIDYVADGYAASEANRHSRLSVVTAPAVTIGGRTIELEPLSWAKLEGLHALSDHESNVATGFHTIEFLLWGQDLHGHTPGAGERPWTDYSRDAATCTDGPRRAPLAHCQRRGAYLITSAHYLAHQLTLMRARWADAEGSYGDRLVRGDAKEGLRRALFGLASMSGEELASERMQVALMAGSPEEEQDCFSDDTHQSLYFNAVGIENLYRGRFGEQTFSPSLSDLAQAVNPELAKRIDRALTDTRDSLQAIREAADTGRPFDVLIAPDAHEGHALIRTAMAHLHAQTAAFEALGEALQLGDLNPQAPRGVPERDS
ncbi:imelysin family protein [Algiphilus sp.]|uniref:imelysin family protein n=1 Tax=Algiphilus sp. TaxID=1872431 RepID=UPI003B525BF5